MRNNNVFSNKIDIEKIIKIKIILYFFDNIIL